MSFSPEHARKYFEIRLQGQRFGRGPEIKARCPLHDDHTPSLSVHLEKGLWTCFAGCGKGGVLDFEMKFSRCDPETARANVAELVGDKKLFSPARKPEAVYQYADASGRLVFEKVRYPGKRFVQRRPDAKGGYEYKLAEGPKPLYHLQEVLCANHVIVCEGEKDVDNVRALNLSKSEENWFVATTTNFDGAGKWRDEYAVFFAGKKVVILPDNDEPGRRHAEQVAASVHRYAAGVKVVPLPGLPEKGDVSDWLETHTADDLVAEIKNTPAWTPCGPGEPRILVPATKFAASAREEVDWMVERLIERGANGAIVAEPKVGKTWAAIELAVCLALGVDFMEFTIPRPVKTALISREDNPALTAWRLRHLFAGKEAENPDLLASNLYVNTRQQSKQLLLDNPEQMAELLADLRLVKPEFVILDVLNVLHTADENDNTEMRQVLSRLDEIRREIGCAVCIVHHFNKLGSGSITQRMRGSSAIAGWCEFLMGITVEDEERKIRRMTFELKAAEPPEPVYWIITSGPGVATLKRVPAHQEASAAVH